MTRRRWTDADLAVVRATAELPAGEAARVLNTTLGMVHVMRQRVGANLARRLCPVCQASIPPSTAGRRRTYCSHECVLKAARRRAEASRPPKDMRPPEERPCVRCGVGDRLVQPSGKVRGMCRSCDNAYQRARVAKMRSERRKADRGV